jgi:two-component system response regulator PilR (NtrC family)
MEILTRYHWPGNVRELENVIERAVALETTDRLTPASISVQVRADNKDGEKQSLWSFTLPPQGINLESAVSQIERDLMLQALERSGWVQSKAAELLNLTFRAFRYKVKKYGISKVH